MLRHCIAHHASPLLCLALQLRCSSMPLLGIQCLSSAYHCSAFRYLAAAVWHHVLPLRVLVLPHVTLPLLIYDLPCPCRSLLSHAYARHNIALPRPCFTKEDLSFPCLCFALSCLSIAWHRLALPSLRFTSLCRRQSEPCSTNALHPMDCPGRTPPDRAKPLRVFAKPLRVFTLP